MKNWSGQQVREEAHEQCIVEQARLSRSTATHVHEIRDLRKREETDAQWQGEVQQRDRCRSQLFRAAQSEVCILEDSEEEQIGCDAECQQNSPVARASAQSATDVEVDADTRQNERQMLRTPPAVEKERGCNQRRDSPRWSAAEHEIQGQRYRKEVNEVFVAIEQHGKRFGE